MAVMAIGRCRTTINTNMKKEKKRRTFYSFYDLMYLGWKTVTLVLGYKFKKKREKIE